MAIPYDIPSATVDGNDPIAVAEAAELALAHSRSGQGPYFLVLKTYRTKGHAEYEDGDNVPYRTFEEVESWRQKDPIPRMRDALLDWGIITTDDVSRIQAEAEAEVEDAAQFMVDSPEADVEEAYTDVYV